MSKKILIVDDTEMNRAMLRQILEEEYEILEAANGKEALAVIEPQFNELSIVLLDLIMPQMNGFEVLEVMQEKGWIDRLPVLVITSEDSSATENKCFQYGVSDFITKPFSNPLVKMRVNNIVTLFEYKKALEEREQKNDQLLAEIEDIQNLKL